jgi:hypothetical protein
MMDNKQSGIYSITNKETGRIYIGRSIDIQRRWKEHKRQLSQGKHGNPRLQNDYKEGIYEYKVIGYYPESEIGFRELECYLTTDNPYNCIGTKDWARYYLAKRLIAMGLDDVEVDHFDKDCSPVGGESLVWAVYARYGIHEFYVHLTSMGDGGDFPDGDRSIIAESIRKGFIQTSRTKNYIKEVFKKDDKDEVNIAKRITDKIKLLLEKKTDFYF